MSKMTRGPALHLQRRIVASWKVFFAIAVAMSGSHTIAQVDPGVRSGPSDAGGPIKGLSEGEQRQFWASWQRFKEVYSVSGSIETGAGLGPRFNGNSCAGCHAQPAAGGSSSGPSSPQVRRIVMRNGRLVLDTDENLQVALSTLDRTQGENQTVPSFMANDGPIRVARFITNSDGTPDGEVHQIFTIAGRTDAPGCRLAQPDFAEEIERENVVFRIPTPTFGAGLIEAVSDAALVASLEGTLKERRESGIGGRFNRSDDGTIARFGWKAQRKSVLTFASEAFNVEMGLTSDAFPRKRGEIAGCVFSRPPGDPTREQTASTDHRDPPEVSPGVTNLAAFMRLLAAPVSGVRTASERRGQQLFSVVGCALCHTESFTTGASPYKSLTNVTIHPYSDFALHRMGPGLADHIEQGVATGDEFRTAPLWGLGQRIFFLHDGRTNDL
jgi:CxxC motif-containing protein (DUF1111 family)